MRISGAVSALPLGRSRRLDRQDLAAIVVAAGRADVVRALELVAVRALDERRDADGKVRASLALARLGYLSLGDAHA
jgi:hypothetical protein